MSWVYGTMSIALVPWIIYLQSTLPEQRASLSWRVMWVVFDLVLLAVSTTATYFLYKKSPWAGSVLLVLGTLLSADTWFDTMTSPLASDVKTATLLDICVELPLALFTLGCGIFILRRVITQSTKAKLQ